MTLSIGAITLPSPVVLAPMAGITNAPYRTLCREYGGGLFVSEMIGARALTEGNAKTRELTRFGPGETPRSLQLYGTDPTAIGEAVRMLVDIDHVDHIDLNFGCPAPKITRHGGGAAVPYKRRLFAAIVASAVDAAGGVPVTVKMRIGLDDDHPTHIESGRVAQDLGAAAVALHARTAEQLYAGEARWHEIEKLKVAVTTIPVLGNGDIWEAEDAARMMDQTGCDGVVIGRGCLGRPWFFRELEETLKGAERTAAPTLGGVVVAMRRHARLLVDWFGTAVGIRSFRKHPGWYLKGFPIGNDVRHLLNQVEDLDHLDELLEMLDPSLPYPLVPDARRGHTHGPRRMKLPTGFLDDPDEMPRLPEAAGEAVSGG